MILKLIFKLKLDKVTKKCQNAEIKRRIMQEMKSKQNKKIQQKIRQKYMNKLQINEQFLKKIEQK